MTTVDVGFLGVASSLVLVVVALVLSMAEGLGLERSILWAALRAFAQMMVIGAGLSLVFEPEAPMVWSWLWVAAMVLVGAATVSSRVGGLRGTFTTALLALGCAQAVSLAVVYGLGVMPLEPRTLVPVAGMLLGNCIGATVLAARRTLAEVQAHRDDIEVRIALGWAARDAVRPHLAEAMRTSVTPQVEQTKIIGLIALPGTMTGLLLAGVDPLDAVLTQIVVVFLILGSVAVTAVLVGRGTARRLTTADHRLVLPPTG